MKKLKLKMQELNSPEVLTRQQLKNVLGGTSAVTTKGCNPACTNGYEGGTCSKGTPVTVGGLTITPCNCSVSNGNGCGTA